MFACLDGIGHLWAGVGIERLTMLLINKGYTKPCYLMVVYACNWHTCQIVFVGTLSKSSFDGMATREHSSAILVKLCSLELT